MLTLALRPLPILASVAAAAVAYADSGPALYIDADAGVVAYPGARIQWFFDHELVLRVPESELWVRSSAIKDVHSWDGLEALGRPLLVVLEECARLGAYAVEAFEDGDEEPQWPQLLA